MGTQSNNLVETRKDFSTQTSARSGEVAYVFEKKRCHFDNWLIWPLAILGFLTMAVFLLQVILAALNTMKMDVKLWL